MNLQEEIKLIREELHKEINECFPLEKRVLLKQLVADLVNYTWQLEHEAHKESIKVLNENWSIYWLHSYLMLFFIYYCNQIILIFFVYLFSI